jgi:hypothetical protein
MSASAKRAASQRDRADRKSQCARILSLLIDARGSWVPLPEILACAAQYNARLYSLRRLGFHIENRTERDAAGAVHSWYQLINSAAPQPVKSEDPKPIADSADWYTTTTGKPRPSLDRESPFLFDARPR